MPSKRSEEDLGWPLRFLRLLNPKQKSCRRIEIFFAEQAQRSSHSRRTQPRPALQLSRKLRSTLDRLGCLSFRNALASICRIRSRVTENCWPTCSNVWSLFMPIPKRMRKVRSSRALSEASTLVVVSRWFIYIACSCTRRHKTEPTSSRNCGSFAPGPYCHRVQEFFVGVIDRRRGPRLLCGL